MTDITTLDALLAPIQQSQLALELARVLAHGFGSLRLRIEKGQLRWLYPAQVLYSPNGPHARPVLSGGLAELLGPWLESFVISLARLMGDGQVGGFGDLVLTVEHGAIRSIVPTPDVRVRTGDTDKLNSVDGRR
jgi:hypothetical protein